MKRKLLIAAGVVALLGANQAFGQERTKENYPIKGGDFYTGTEHFLQRVDANAAGTEIDQNNAISYATKGVTVPFYIAPSRVTHPDWNPESGVLNPKTSGSPATALTFSSQWSLLLKPGTTPATGLTFVGSLAATDPHANKVKVTGTELGEYVVQAKETPTGAAFNCMKEDDLPEFKLRVISEPQIGLDKEAQTVADAFVTNITVKEIPEYDVKNGATVNVPAFLTGKKVLLANTCNKALISGVGAKIKLANTLPESWDAADPKATATQVPNDLRKFAFSIRTIKVNVDKTGAAKAVDQAEAKDATIAYGMATTDGSLNKKLAIPTTDVSVDVTLPTIDIDVASERSVDIVYFLSSPVGDGVPEIGTGQQGGVISSLSHRSSVDPEKPEADQNITTYPFGDYSILVVRLSEPPITGPIYHIPSSLFNQ